MNEKIAALKASFEAELSQVVDMAALEALRVGYLGKKGKMTELLKGMGNMSVEERKTIGAETNELKNEITVALAEKLEAMKAAELQQEIDALPEFDISMPANMERGSYHPITVVSRRRHSCTVSIKDARYNIDNQLAGAIIIF